MKLQAAVPVAGTSSQTQTQTGTTQTQHTDRHTTQQGETLCGIQPSPKMLFPLGEYLDDIYCKRSVIGETKMRRPYFVSVCLPGFCTKIFHNSFSKSCPDFGPKFSALRHVDVILHPHRFGNDRRQWWPLDGILLYGDSLIINIYLCTICRLS
jgi:hypothetical protein